MQSPAEGRSHLDKAGLTWTGQLPGQRQRVPSARPRCCSAPRSPAGAHPWTGNPWHCPPGREQLPSAQSPSPWRTPSLTPTASLPSCSDQQGVLQGITNSKGMAVAELSTALPTSSDVTAAQARCPRGRTLSHSEGIAGNSNTLIIAIKTALDTYFGNSGGVKNSIYLLMSKNSSSLLSPEQAFTGDPGNCMFCK